jgi:hypothetical protein
MVVSTAVWLGAYEIELKPSGTSPRLEVDKSYFGFGLRGRLERGSGGGGRWVDGVSEYM